MTHRVLTSKSKPRSDGRLVRLLLLVVVALSTVSGICAAQSPDNASKSRLQVLSLKYDNDGQHLQATVGEPIEITLQSIGPRQWGPPQVSSPAVRFEHVMLKMPVIPAGPTQLFIFDAAAGGEAKIQIPYADSGNVFSVTIEVKRPTGKAQAVNALDQGNTAVWREAWTNLLNDARQTFKPSRPILTRVEVELVVANPGPPEDWVTMTLLDPDDAPVAVVTRPVSADDCVRVAFVIPGGGVEVSPGRVYSIRLAGSERFGWKYVVGGYADGEALFNDKPLLQGGRATFLFRTYGAS
jgi:hypothetical protein